jgi:mRNA interferase RelE/StbE
VAGRVIQRLESLQETPRPSGARKLATTESTYRIRIGDYRVVYEINDAEQTVFVTIIAHRREVYRGL